MVVTLSTAKLAESEDMGQITPHGAVLLGSKLFACNLKKVINLKGQIKKYVCFR